MSAPKTIYIGGIEAGKLTWQWHSKVDLDWDCHYEYRLVDPNEQSKIERIRDEAKEIERMYYQEHKDLCVDQLVIFIATDIIEIIDRISNESDSNE